MSCEILQCRGNVFLPISCLLEHVCSPTVLSCVRVTQSLVFCVVFCVDQCLSFFVIFTYGQWIVFPTSMCGIMKLFLLLFIKSSSICHISTHPFCVVTVMQHIYIYAETIFYIYRHIYIKFCYIVWACVLSGTILKSFVVSCLAWFCMVFMFKRCIFFLVCSCFFLFVLLNGVFFVVFRRLLFVIICPFSLFVFAIELIASPSTIYCFRLSFWDLPSYIL